jgi:hypothetical protein
MSPNIEVSLGGGVKGWGRQMSPPLVERHNQYMQNRSLTLVFRFNRHKIPLKLPSRILNPTSRLLHLTCHGPVTDLSWTSPMMGTSTDPSFTGREAGPAPCLGQIKCAIKSKLATFRMVSECWLFPFLSQLTSSP